MSQQVMSSVVCVVEVWAGLPTCGQMQVRLELSDGSFLQLSRTDEDLARMMKRLVDRFPDDRETLSSYLLTGLLRVRAAERSSRPRVKSMEVNKLLNIIINLPHKFSQSEAVLDFFQPSAVDRTCRQEEDRTCRQEEDRTCRQEDRTCRQKDRTCRQEEDRTCRQEEDRTCRQEDRTCRQEDRTCRQEEDQDLSVFQSGVESDVLRSNGFCLANTETVLFDLTPPTHRGVQSEDSSDSRCNADPCQGEWWSCRLSAALSSVPHRDDGSTGEEAEPQKQVNSALSSCSLVLLLTWTPETDILDGMRTQGMLVLVSVSAFVEELDDSFMETRGADDIWLIKFYAPWCSFCKQLDPVWHQIGSELRSVGSPVNVGKVDATISTGLAREFRVRGFPAILMWKKNIKYNYSGPRTRDAVLDFAVRVGGPLVRSLSSLQLFQHAMSRHDVMFVYIGATSALKGNFSAAAEELIVYTNFFSASRDILPKAVSVPSLPAVVVFKDGTFFTFNEERDGDLKSWINRERFPNYSEIDSYTLYAMGESGKLVALTLVDETSLTEESLRYKLLVEKVAADYREIYSRSFFFGVMEGSDYINGLVMSEVTLPSFIVLDLSTDGYFLPLDAMETERHLLDFLDGVLDGSIQVQGGNGVAQRVQRFIYDVRVTLMPLFSRAPLLGCLLLSFPLLLGAFFCFLCCKARSSACDRDDDNSAALAPSLPPSKKTSDKKAD